MFLNQFYFLCLIADMEEHASLSLLTSGVNN